MLDEPTFSVIIPTHNYGHYLPTTLESVLAQGRRDAEVIVVDDASSDSTRMIVQRFLDEVTYIRLESNVGPAEAWRIGLDAASGQYVCKLDADDWHLPGFLEAVDDAFRSFPSAGMVTCPVYIYSESSGLACPTRVKARQGILSPLEFRSKLIRGFFFYMPGVAVRRAALSGHSGPRSDLWMAHDWEYFIRIMAGWGCAVLGEPRAVYRTHVGSVTDAGRRDERLRNDMTKLLMLAADDDSGLDLDAQEKRVFAKALADSYLQVTRLGLSRLDFAGAAEHIGFAAGLAANGTGHLLTGGLIAARGAIAQRLAWLGHHASGRRCVSRAELDALGVVDD